MSAITRLCGRAIWIDHGAIVADGPADAVANNYLSTLEEISKSTGFGPKVREYGKHDADQLRNEVFQMVRAGVFQEYRDARFMKDFLASSSNISANASGSILMNNA